MIMTFIDIIRESIPILVLIGQIMLFAIGFIYLLRKPLKTRYSQITKFIRKNAVLLSFFVAALSMFGSLFYSIGLGWQPCELCWYQRIVMYPLAIIFGAALITKRKDVNIYTIPLALIGSVISGYHYFTQWVQMAATCSTDVGCNFIYVQAFGYVTIPLMAFTGFALVLAFSLYLRKK